MMGKRRKAREVALQFLYQLDLGDETDPTPHESEFWTRHRLDPDAQAFARQLVHGTKANQPHIDELIAQCAEHWNLERMSVVDRNILRVAIFELSCQPNVPAKVAINEAIEIAKKFGTKESARFINGILDRVHRELHPSATDQAGPASHVS